MPPLLSAEQIHRVYALPRTSLFGPRAVRRALDGVDVTLHDGGSLGIVGESGSGKSTLVRILLGLDRATAGVVRYRDRVIEPGRPRELRWFRREAQVVLQDPLSSLDPRMTIASIIREPLVCLDVPGDHDARIAEVLTAVGLDPQWRRRYPHEFSGGQQQRIAIARAIAAAADAARRRRAGQRPRRLRARADPRPAAPVGRRVPLQPDPGVARPRCGALPVPGRDRVAGRRRRRARGDRHRAVAAGAPVHAGAPPGRAPLAGRESGCWRDLHQRGRAMADGSWSR